MIYHVGDPYRTITRMKGGSPVYEIVTIRSVTKEALVLENDQKIDLVPPVEERK